MSLAVFTIARNESVFLPLWLRYYRQFTMNLFVLDHESDDESTDGPGFTRIPITNTHSEDVHWMRHLVQEKQKELLEPFERVIFVEADEFLIPNPCYYRHLGHYLETHPEEMLTATGFDVCGRSDSEPLSFGRILRTRNWKHNDRYDKTLISKRPLTWEVGFHRPEGVQRPDPDPHLLLVHLHYACRETAWKRLEQRMRGKIVPEGCLGIQNKIRDRGAFDNHYDDAIRGAIPIPSYFWESL